MKKNESKLRAWGWSLSLILLALAPLACSTTRHLEEDQYLLRSVRIEIDSPNRELPPTADLKTYLGQVPNRKLFGLFDWPLGLYNLSNPESKSWLNRQLRKWGSPPVIFSKEEAQISQSNLTSAMYNLGYLRASTALQIDTLSPKKLRASYLITLGERFHIARHQELIADSTFRLLLHPEDAISQRKRFPSERYTSLLSPGSPLAPNLMQEERKRITHILRNRGYWDFHEEQIRFDVDTLAGAQNAWINTVIDGTSSVYRIGKVRMHHALPPQEALGAKIDTTHHSGIALYRGDRQRLRSRLLSSRSKIVPGDLYSQEATSQTYVALSDLPAIRSVSIHYKTDSTAPTPTLDVDIHTTAEQSKEIIADLIGTHSGGNLGLNTSLVFMHNNLFRGSEQFKLLGRVGYEELNGLSRDHLSYGVEASLNIPRLALPFFIIRRQTPFRGQSSLRLSYDYQTRPEFKRNLLSASISYTWMRLDRPAWSFTVRPLEVDYIHFTEMDDSFLQSLPAYASLLSYRNQFIVSAGIMLSYDSQKDYRLSHSPFRHNLRFYAQSAGNSLALLSPLLGGERDAFGSYKWFGINFAQFLRGEFDYSGLYRLGGKNALAYRLGISAVYPYGNSGILPVDLRYFSGGSSSVRGWGIRELGPGSTPKRLTTNIFQQVGDLKIDLGAELRLRVSRSWEWATFVDTGNVWTLREYGEQPGGQFKLKSFISEMALSTGMGLRWDFDYFILRFDAGLKLYDPQEEKGHRWISSDRSLGNLLAFHFALGYPF